MKKIFMLLIFILLIPIYVHATDYIPNMDKPGDVCAAIANQDLTVNIYSQRGNNTTTFKDNDLEYYGIYKIDDHNFQMKSASNTNCINLTYRDRLINNVSSQDNTNYPSWVYIARMLSSDNVYIDDMEVNRSDYNYVRIGNRLTNFNTSNKLLWTSTLKPDELVYYNLNINNLVKTDVNANLHLVMRVGFDSSDINIATNHAMTYYIYDTNGMEYGPYHIDSFMVDKIVTLTSGTKITIYKIVSQDLLQDVLLNTTIDSIKFVPYEEYRLFSASGVGGEFKLFGLFLDMNNSMLNETVVVNNAESVMRHRMVDNRMTQGFVKWRGSDDEDKGMNVYYCQTIFRKVSLTNDNIYYGQPYNSMRMFSPTFDGFINQMTYSNGEYAYHIADTYYENTETMQGYLETQPSLVFRGIGDIIQPEMVNNVGFINIINYYKSYSTIMDKYRNKNSGASADLKNPNKEFIMNSGKYIYGFSCTSSISAAVASEVSTNKLSSGEFPISNLVEIVGDLELTSKDVEDALRCNNIIGNDEFITKSVFDDYHSSVIKGKYGEQKIYNAYGLSNPGDVINHVGHARFVSGYSHVVCGDGTVFEKGDYTNNACLEHNGINPEESYVITTEGGTSFDDRTKISESHVATNKTGWSYTFDSKYTDADTSWLDGIYNGNVAIKTTFRPNLKYSFADLYGASSSDDDTGEDIEDTGNMICEGNDCEEIVLLDVSANNTGCIPVNKEESLYLPYRYKSLSKMRETNNVEVPNVSLSLDREYSSSELYNYVKENKKLKGTITSNYQIDGIKIEIDYEKYYIHPMQTRIFSLYDELDNEILNALNNEDIEEIKISVKSGPASLTEISNKLGDKMDDEGYIMVKEIHPATYNINYYLSNSLVSDMSMTCTYGRECTLSNNTFTSNFPLKSNKWQFAGYSTSQVSTDISYRAGDTFIYDMESDLNLYVVGKRDFKFSSGIAPTDTPIIETQYWNTTDTTSDYYTGINVPNASPIEGWEFIGYRATDSASGTKTIAASYAGNVYKPAVNSLSAFVFRSIYQRNITINYDLNGGIGIVNNDTKTQYYNSGYGNGTNNSGANVSNVIFTLPSGKELTKEGYTFAGWAESNEAIIPILNSTFSFSPEVSDKVTTKALYAVWNYGEYMKGDMNKNGHIDLADIIILLKIYLNGGVSEEELYLGDMDYNETIGLRDIIMLLKVYLMN